MRNSLLTAIITGSVILAGGSQIEDGTFVTESAPITIKEKVLGEEKSEGPYDELCPEYDYERIGLNELLRGYISTEKSRKTATAERILKNLENLREYNLSVEKKDGSWTLPIKVSKNDKLIFFYKKTKTQDARDKE